MCGIAGIVTLGRLDPQALAGASRALAHRGPDGEGFLVSDLGAPLQMTRTPGPPPSRRPVVALAHRRLSIIDPSQENDQPLVDATGDLAIAFNGEIYNYLELRQELQALGHRFRTSGDTEVALAAYAQWGAECVERFVGMWALAICDRRRRQLLLTRDRFGIKPLYLSLTGDQLVFASEIKGLMAAGLPVPRPNERVVARYLLGGPVDDGAETFYAGIRQLPAASLASFSLDGSSLSYQPRRYWSLPDAVDGRGVKDASTAVRRALEESVRLHLRSDVAVGSCLSGGIDSSGIVCLAERVRPPGDLTFTHKGVGYLPPERELSERSYMEAAARQCGAQLIFVAPSAAEFHDRLGEVIAAQDEPFGSASIAAQWFVFRAAAENGITVMLDGQGADEVFGGYHHYLRLIAQRMLLQHDLRGFTDFIHSAAAAVGQAPYPLWLAPAALLPASMQRRARRWLVTRLQGRAPLSEGLRQLARTDDEDIERDGDHDVILRADLHRSNLPALLRYEDRNSMAHSIEARVPYLDHRLVELAFGLPLSVRMHGAEPKWVLREALADLLPPSVKERRDKIGFRASPQVTWSLARWIWRDRSAVRNGPAAPWLSPDRTDRLLSLSNPNIEDEFALWRAVNVTLWARRMWS